MTSPTFAGSFSLPEQDLALATDLYQLTMAAAYCALDPMPRGTFELFVRKLPPHRNFLVWAGLEQALEAVGALRFHEPHLEYLRSLEQFQGMPQEQRDRFFEALASFRFSGEIRAMREGTVFFPGEPALQVTGTLLEAQILETLLLSVLNFQTAVASKAARIRRSADSSSGGRPVQLAEFGTRRAHGPQAGAWVARAAYLAGFDATSNLLAGWRAGVPVTGTMAHSFVLAFDDEEEAFRHYAQSFPQHATHLVDTFDTLAGVEKALDSGLPFQAVRLDSGDLGALAKEVRKALDGAGRGEVKIFASGNLDEHSIAELLGKGAPIDAFGVGTRLAALTDASHLGGVYKLVEVEKEGLEIPKAKNSAGKRSVPWRKQVYRRREGGKIVEDLVQRAVDPAPHGDWEALLVPVFRDGKPLETEGLEETRRRCARSLEELPETYPYTLRWEISDS